MMSGKEAKNRAQVVRKRLDKLSRAPVVAAAREFRLAGLTTAVGCCYFHAGLRDFRTIELVANSTIEQKDYRLTISWHVAWAHDKSDLLVVITGTGEKGDSNETIDGLSPLTNIEGQALLPLLHQHFTGISLLDAPRILGCCLEDGLQAKGINSRNYQALQRTLSSAYQATQPVAPQHGTGQLRHFKIAIPLLISPTDLYEANCSDQGVKADDCCFMGIRIADNTGRVNQPVVDIINPDFLATYAKMAAETAERLPQLIDQHLSDDPPIRTADSVNVRDSLELEPRLGKQSQLDAWEKFRNL